MLVMTMPFMTGVVNAGRSGHLQGSGALLGKTEGSESFSGCGTQGVGKVTGRVCGQGVYHGDACRGRELECSARVSPLAHLGAIWGSLGLCCGPLGPSWALLGLCWGFAGGPGALLQRPCVHLGPSGSDENPKRPGSNNRFLNNGNQ